MDDHYKYLDGILIIALYNILFTVIPTLLMMHTFIILIMHRISKYANTYFILMLIKGKKPANVLLLH